MKLLSVSLKGSLRYPDWFLVLALISVPAGAGMGAVCLFGCDYVGVQDAVDFAGLEIG